jgi:hypothetical protein
LSKLDLLPGAIREDVRMRRFYDCTMSEKLLFTSFLLIIGLGYLMAMVFLYTTHQGHDGKPGLSMADIADNYYGNRSGTRLEAALRGPMASYIELQDRHEIVAWLKSGAPEKKYAPLIRPILEKTCLNCHTSESGLNIPDFSTYEGIRTVAAVDTGESLHTLMKLSHIHLFGIGLILFGVGMIFRYSVLPPPLKYTLILLPFIAMFADILAWFLTKWDPIYAFTVVIGGSLLGLSLGAQILISLYQLWFLKAPIKAGSGKMAKGPSSKAA